MPDPLPIARNANAEFALLPALANRHGLITGATGTGKTVTLQVLAERFSAIGVPVFMADVKGDLAGHQPARRAVAQVQRAARSCSASTAPTFAGLPGRVLGRLRRAGPSGPRDGLRHRARCCSRASSTSTTRRRACWRWCSRSPTTTACCCSTSRTCGRCCSTSATTRRSSRPTTATSRRRRSARSSAACSRSSSRAASSFFGEPMLNIDDLIQTDGNGRGVVNILAADKLMQLAASSTRRCCCGCCRSSTSACPKSATATSPSSSSSSTRRTCCSPTRRRRCSTRSSRSSA